MIFVCELLNWVNNSNKVRLIYEDRNIGGSMDANSTGCTMSHITFRKIISTAIALCPQKFIYNVSAAEHQFDTLPYLTMHFKKLQPNMQKKNCSPEKFKTARPGTNEPQ
jgi:hypothetical protein